MWAWYRRAGTCYTYLSDARDPSPRYIQTRDTHLSKFDNVPAWYPEPLVMTNAMPESRWFTRGWTLQELLALEEVKNFSHGWVLLGTRFLLREEISSITRIDHAYFSRARSVQDASVAARMSWAAHRQTTRVEDQAYCLMGLFSVNMPMLYGEGDQAFRRLQEEIIRHSDDHSLFTWEIQDPSNLESWSRYARSSYCIIDSKARSFGQQSSSLRNDRHSASAVR